MAGKIDSNEWPDYAHEAELGRIHRGPIAGIDEAGRGPWAGPVVAAAVILNPDAIPEGLNDSKKLGEAAREALFEQLSSCATIGVGIADVERIDRDNILQATFWAMGQACAALSPGAACALVDGNRCPPLPCPATPLVKGDARSLSIAAASIVAKVTRDRIMTELAIAHPHYGWERNKGYGTKAHTEGLSLHGVTEHHRRSYKPVQAYLGQTELRPAG